ncbi:hypothetical protein HMPREF9098_0104 [Kingella denitrificans ATCC 33394]|uniref:Uncharacterized protein n=1 Tax=Kingella denitrificans ATCC 33394 TaxID=888741 RepID=F0EW70_9NEIS|nr:hypothetical protein HMPREF9098_0104 [Kingella denitrificans ATCC 33394]
MHYFIFAPPRPFAHNVLPIPMFLQPKNKSFIIPPYKNTRK